MDKKSLIAPHGTKDCEIKYHGRCEKKPWEYDVTVAVPHLDTLEPLLVLLELLRLQTVRPYIMVIDTGSPDDVKAKLEKLRAPDLEIHYVAAHAYRHSSEPVTVALDLAQTLCRTELLFHTHTDCFPRRRDLLEMFARITNANTPVVGYRMSPRDWVTDEWEWMVGHTALMLYMPSINRVGATWSFQRIHYAFHYAWFIGGGWPDTETGFNHVLRNNGIVPVFLGFDVNAARTVDDNIDHARSHPGTKIYASHDKVGQNSAEWMAAAITDGRARIGKWRTDSAFTAGG